MQTKFALKKKKKKKKIKSQFIMCRAMQICFQITTFVTETTTSTSVEKKGNGKEGHTQQTTTARKEGNGKNSVSGS